ncbi:MAG TPA: ABC transporter substrate-binding protein [Tepidiformaceae bacterium]|nr:ABC transporter substrate-binding protein [Tepidiformaceae bacterium]
MSNYWDRQLRRRSLLKGAGIATAGVATMALAGCGGGDDDDAGGNGGLAGLAPTATPEAAKDPFAGATPGGEFRINYTGDPPTIDPNGNSSFLTKQMAAFVYSRLYKYKTGPGILRANVRPTGDLVESAESSPDGLKWTLKLRPGMKYHNVAPVNGRAVSTDDIKFSWAKLTDPKNTGSGTVRPVVDRLDVLDDRTIQFTLKTPNATFLDLLADANLLWILPTESDGKFDPAKTMIGSGPFIFDSYTPGVNFKMKKNPEWYEKGRPFFDSVTVSIIPEYANYLAQFLSGNLDQLAVNANDLVDVVRNQNISVNSYQGNGANWLWFDGTDPNAPYYKDERIRQAVSMSINRDELTELAYNIKKLEAAGLKPDKSWNNLIPVGWGRFWIDPKSSEFGENGKYFKYDPAEAKKLLSAAGYSDSNPLNVTYQYTANRYGKTFNDVAEASLGYINAVGIKTTTDVQDYASRYITQTFLGNFKGLAFGVERGYGEKGNYLVRLFTDNADNKVKVLDPTMMKYAADQAAELDDTRRVKIFHDAQRYQASKMYYIPVVVGAGQTWVCSHKTVQNAGDFFTAGYGMGTEQYPYMWLKKA